MFALIVGLTASRRSPPWALPVGPDSCTSLTGRAESVSPPTDKERRRDSGCPWLCPGQVNFAVRLGCAGTRLHMTRGRDRVASRALRGFGAERRGTHDSCSSSSSFAVILILGILLAPLGAGIITVATLIPDRDRRHRGLGPVFGALSARQP